MSAAQTAVAPDTRDPVFLRRMSEVPAHPLGPYDTTEAIPGATPYRPLPVAPQPKISPAARAAAVAYAMANTSTALLIWRDGALELQAYAPGADAATPINGLSMAKPLGAIAVGRAIELGAIAGLDQPAADFITEWKATPKAAITLRELLNMTAGLQEQGPIKGPNSVMARAYVSQHHDRPLIDDYPLTAPPGSRYQYSNASADLIAVVIERATHRRYAEFVSTEIFKPIGAAGGDIWVDRPGGLVHSGCCIMAPAQTWLRLGLLLMNDGRWDGRRLLPAGYVAQMRTPSADNPRYGLGIWLQGPYIQRRGFGSASNKMLSTVLQSEPYLADDLYMFDGNADQVLYMIPSQKLAILRMGGFPPKSPEWDNAYLANLVLHDLGAR